MIRLMRIDSHLLERWFTLPIETAQGYPFAFGARGSEIVYYMSKTNLAMGVPERWAYRYFIVCEISRLIVGTIGFRSGPSEGFLEVGYTVSPDHQGKGIASDALRQLIAISVKSDPELGYKARVFSSNAASIKVLERAGFIFNGHGKDEAGRDRDVYALTAESAQALYTDCKKPVSIVA